MCMGYAIPVALVDACHMMFSPSSCSEYDLQYYTQQHSALVQHLFMSNVVMF